MDELLSIFKSYLRVSQRMSHLFRARFGQLDLTLPQALVITTLVEEGTMPISALAERTGSANSTISGIVDRLERLGLVQRSRSELDRRVIYVTTTEKCQQLQSRAETDIVGYFATIMGDIGQNNQAMIACALQQMDDALADQIQREEVGGAAFPQK